MCFVGIGPIDDEGLNVGGMWKMRVTKAGRIRKILMTMALVLAMAPLFAMAVYATEPLDDDSVTIEGMEYSD